jgi:hypothetical protein
MTMQELNLVFISILTPKPSSMLLHMEEELLLR